MKKYNEIIFGEKALWRIIAITIIFFTFFYISIIISQLFLPEGFLKEKTIGGNLDTSSTSVVISTLQIFLYNMISVVFIIIASAFAKRKNKEDVYCSYGINALIVLSVIDGVVLGTNSFGIDVENMPLFKKIISTFNIVTNAMMWEIMGLVLITSFLANKAIVLTTGKETYLREKECWKYYKKEWIIFALGIILIFIGAFVESVKIIGHV